MVSDKSDSKMEHFCKEDVQSFYSGCKYCECEGKVGKCDERACKYYKGKVHWFCNKN